MGVAGFSVSLLADCCCCCSLFAATCCWLTLGADQETTGDELGASTCRSTEACVERTVPVKSLTWLLIILESAESAALDKVGPIHTNRRPQIRTIDGTIWLTNGLFKEVVNRHILADCIFTVLVACSRSRCLDGVAVNVVVAVDVVVIVVV